MTGEVLLNGAGMNSPGAISSALDIMEKANFHFSMATQINPLLKEAWTNWGTSLGYFGEHYHQTNAGNLGPITASTSSSYYYNSTGEKNNNNNNNGNNGNNSTGNSEDRMFEEAHLKFQIALVIDPDFLPAQGNLVVKIDVEREGNIDIDL